MDASINTIEQSDVSNASGEIRPAYLAPIRDENLYDKELENFFHNWLQGITRLPAGLIRPAYQPEPPALPKQGTDWLGFFIAVESSDIHATNVVRGNEVEVHLHEVIRLAVSFYGNNARKNAKQLKLGLFIPQNRFELTSNRMGLISSGPIVTLPELVKEQWLYRADMSIAIRRHLLTTYPLEEINSVSIDLYNEFSKQVINS